MEPTKTVNGLALYSRGEGKPVFIMPYPHASTYRSVAEGRLAELLIKNHFRIISFDPPSFVNSTRSATSSLEEMFETTQECLRELEIDTPLPFIGHSMGGFVSLAFSIEKKGLISRLLISGSPSGWNDVRKYSIHKKWNWRQKAFWLSRYWGGRIILDMANLEIHRRLDNLVNYESFHDKSFFEEIEILPGDRHTPPPPRASWLKNVRNYEYGSRLNEIDIPVLITAGKHDPVVPAEVSKKMADRIAGARLEIFRQSGHSPFIEEPDKFIELAGDFLRG
jgi:proline iminopeptidase